MVTASRGRPPRLGRNKGTAVVSVFNNAGKNPTFIMPVSLVRNLNLSAGDKVQISWEDQQITLKKVDQGED